MLLTIEDIKCKFNELINEEISREDADEWAYIRMQAYDDGNLEFQPSNDQELLWGAIQYLYGIDIKDSPSSYLHSLEDIQVVFETTWNK